MKAIQDKKEIRLAGTIIMFALLAFISPRIWERYDKTPTFAKTAGSEYQKPKPRPEYTLKTFFSLIDDYSINEAISLMDKQTINNAWSIWEEDFSNIYFIKLRNYEEISSTNDSRTYRVRTDVRLKSQDLKTQWTNGENTRIISLKLINGEWRIQDIKPEQR